MSALTEYSDLYPILMPELPGCPQALILSYIKQVAYDFCDQSEAWLEWLVPSKIRTGVKEYYLDTEYDAEIRRIKVMRLNTESGVENGDNGRIYSGDLYEFDQTDNNKLTLDDSLEPRDDVAKGLEIRAVLVPCLNAESISTCFFNRWHTGIRAGVLYRLLSMNGQPWSDSGRAVIEYQTWRDKIGAAKSEHHKAGTDRQIKISA